MARTNEDDNRDDDDDVEPFTNELQYTLIEKIQLGVLGVVLVPVRTALAAGICSAYFCLGVVLLARSGWDFLSDRWEDAPLLNAEQAAARRRYCTSFGTLLTRALGIRIEIRGVQATRAEAPLLAMAPHTSQLVDPLLGFIFNCSTLEPIENAMLPPIWPAQRLAQDFYVDRKCAQSKQWAKGVVERRVLSPDPWPQVLVFPEGCQGNGTCLLRFNKVCLAAGVPIQPVAIRYRTAPGKNYVASTRGVSPVVSLLLVMCHPWTWLVVDFLPVYSPSQEEREDPALLATNLQQVMADRLAIPATNYTS